MRAVAMVACLGAWCMGGVVGCGPGAPQASRAVARPEPDPYARTEEARSALARPGAVGAGRAGAPRDQEVLAVVERYRRALVDRDLDTLKALAHPRYNDPVGTKGTADDMKRADLVSVVGRLKERIKSVSFQIDVRRIRWISQGRAEVTAEIEAGFKLRVSPGVDRIHRHRDSVKMVLEKHLGRWLFLQGM